MNTFNVPEVRTLGVLPRLLAPASSLHVMLSFLMPTSHLHVTFNPPDLLHAMFISSSTRSQRQDDHDG